MAKIKFVSVAGYLSHLSDEELVLTEKLRAIMLGISPLIVEKITYNTLFYHYKGLFCYFNKTKQGMDFCFVNGNMLSAADEMRENGRKQIRSFLIDWEGKNLNKTLLRETIIEAMMVKDEIQKAKFSRK